MKTVSRIAARFGALRREGRTGLIPFLTAGDPSLRFTEKAIHLLDRPETAAIEIGVPFSDPLADGPAIQRSSERALARGVTLVRVLDMVERLRPSVAAPLVLMSYMNPLLRLGLERFAARAARAGVDAVIATDLPAEESAEYGRILASHGIGTVFLAAPTSPPERIRRIAAASTAFIYYVSLTGVTGARSALPADLAARLGGVRKITKRPLAVGFGVSSAAEVRRLVGRCDAVVVGSALVRAVEGEKNDRDRLAALEKKVAALTVPLGRRGR
ncbi:MAG: tryptophan synthase subunit alpha [Candidatus Eisenbacteria bacterium]